MEQNPQQSKVNKNLNIFHAVFPPEYSGKSVHPRTLDNLNTWTNFTPDISFVRKVYDYEEASSFISEHFDNELLRYFQIQPDGRFKADLWRLCVLYIYGGIYTDIDQELLSPIDSFLDINKYSFCGVTNMERYNLSNGFIYARPNHPIIKKNIELTYERYREAKQGPSLTNVKFIGGCYIMGAAISALTGENLMPLGSHLINDDKCLFLHEKGDISLRDSNKQAFWNSFGVYSDPHSRVMNSRYSSYHTDRRLRNQFVAIT